MLLIFATAIVVQAPEGVVATAQHALAELEFERAVEIAEAGLGQPPHSLEQFVELYRVLGVAHAALGHTADAENAYTELLALQPGFALDYSLPPQVTLPFQRVRARVERAVVLDWNWPSSPLVTDPFMLYLEVVRDDRSRLAAVRLYYRRTSVAYQHIDVPIEGKKATAKIPRPETAQDRPGIISLYAVGFDERGNEILKLGEATTPRQISLHYVRPRRWYEKWWVWAMVGTIVAAGATTTGVLLTREPPSRRDVPVVVP